jgi:hypothetical protein
MPKRDVGMRLGITPFVLVRMPPCDKTTEVT